MQKLFRFLRVLFSEGLLHRRENGERFGFFSLQGWAANMMCSGLIGLVIGGGWMAQRALFEFDARETTSEVLEVASEYADGGRTVYQLTLKWVDHNGTTHVTVPRVRSSAYGVPVGTILNIAYDPDDPTDVRVRTAEGPWYIPKMILLGSSLGLFIGWFFRLRSQARRNRVS